MNRMQNAIELPLHLVNHVNPVDVPITQICTVS
jgi:hypothetical protein